MKQRNCFVKGLGFFFVLLIFWSCSKTDGGYGNNGGGGSTANKISMYNSVFTPSNLTVTTGGTITWKNDDNMVHTVTANDASFNSGDIQPGGSYSRTFNATGVIGYYCMHHSGMTGTVTVVTK